MFNILQMLPKLMPLYNQFAQNPGAFIASRGLNIPPQYMSSPETAVKYLMNQRNLSQDQINYIMNNASQFQDAMNKMTNSGNNNPHW